MNSRMQMYRAVLTKDLRLFWPFVALNGVLLALSRIPPLLELIGPVAGLLQVVLQLSTVLLVFVVIYEDGVVSLSHDWLTRPLPGGTLLLAKTTFLVTAVLLPSITGVVIHNLTVGHSLAESLLAGVAEGADGTLVIGLAVIMAVAAVTAGVRQGILVALAALAVLAFVAFLFGRFMLEDPSSVLTGSSWMIVGSIELMLGVTALLILGFQYHRRHTTAARSIAAVSLLSILAVTMTLTGPRAFALQKGLSRDPRAADGVNVAFAEGCFPSRKLADASTITGGAGRPSAAAYSDELLRRAGAGALAFSTKLVALGVPPEHRLEVDYVDLTYRANGRVVARPLGTRVESHRTTTEDGRAAAEHVWLLPAAETGRVTSAEVALQADLSLTLLEPAASATIDVGAPRRYLAGLGYCSAEANPSTGSVAVHCFKPGIQPAQWVALPDHGNPDTADAGRRVDYAPAALEFLGGRHYRMQLARGDAPLTAVRVIAYQAVAHFDRRLTAPGVLGESASTCNVTHWGDRR